MTSGTYVGVEVGVATATGSTRALLARSLQGTETLD